MHEAAGLISIEGSLEGLSPTKEGGTGDGDKTEHGLDEPEERESVVVAPKNPSNPNKRRAAPAASSQEEGPSDADADAAAAKAKAKAKKKAKKAAKQAAKAAKQKVKAEV